MQKLEKEQNKVVVDRNGQITCACENNALFEGLEPCNDLGEMIEPNAEWTGIYACLRCGAIVDPDKKQIINWHWSLRSGGTNA